LTDYSHISFGDREILDKTMNQTTESLAALDNQLSKRFIELDPSGYMLVYLDRSAGLICAKHFANVINEKGLACDPVTGKPLPTKGKVERTPTATFSGRTAKELCIKIFEQTEPCPISYLDHAAYLGREFVRAEMALVTGQEYVQD
jgi:dihydropteroate synthase